MTPAEARQILGLTGPVRPAVLKKIWRRRCHETHPDTGGSADAFRHVQEAYRVLAALAEEPVARATASSCVSCGGHGYIEIRFGFITSRTTCLHCHGSRPGGGQWPPTR